MRTTLQLELNLPFSYFAFSENKRATRKQRNRKQQMQDAIIKLSKNVQQSTEMKMCKLEAIIQLGSY